MGPNGVISDSRSSAMSEGSGGECETSSTYALSRLRKSFLSRFVFLQLYASIRVCTEHSGPSWVSACARRESSGISMYFIGTRLEADGGDTTEVEMCSGLRGMTGYWARRRVKGYWMKRGVERTVSIARVNIGDSATVLKGAYKRRQRVLRKDAAAQYPRD